MRARRAHDPTDGPLDADGDGYTNVEAHLRHLLACRPATPENPSSPSRRGRNARRPSLGFPLPWDSYAGQLAARNGRQLAPKRPAARPRDPALFRLGPTDPLQPVGRCDPSSLGNCSSLRRRGRPPHVARCPKMGAGWLAVGRWAESGCPPIECFRRDRSSARPASDGFLTQTNSPDHLPAEESGLVSESALGVSLSSFAWLRRAYRNEVVEQTTVQKVG
jgi:hypothetical protein